MYSHTVAEAFLMVSRNRIYLIFGQVIDNGNTASNLLLQIFI